MAVVVVRILILVCVIQLVVLQTCRKKLAFGKRAGSKCCWARGMALVCQVGPRMGGPIVASNLGRPNVNWKLVERLVELKVVLCWLLKVMCRSRMVMATGMARFAVIFVVDLNRWGRSRDQRGQAISVS